MGRGQWATASCRPAQGPRLLIARQRSSSGWPTLTSLQLLVASWRATVGRSPAMPRCPKLTLSSKFFFLLPSLWSTLVGWLQHMPTLPRLLLKTSNTYNFWSIGPKIMKFVLTRSLWRDASSQIISKNLKIKWGQVTLPKTGLVTPCTFSPFGVNMLKAFVHALSKSKFLHSCVQPYDFFQIIHNQLAMLHWSVKAGKERNVSVTDRKV
jgi:hypothetical protein